MSKLSDNDELKESNFSGINLESILRRLTNLSDYLIEGKLVANVLTFRITFNEDKGPNPNYDEAVDAQTTSTVQMYRPNNTNSVDIGAPTFTNTDTL